MESKVTRVVALLLAGLFVVGLSLRFTPPQGGGRPVPISLAERLAVVAHYSSNLSPAIKRQLIEAAANLEFNREAERLINGQPPQSQAPSLSPVYKLMSQQLQNPTAERLEKLQQIAREGRTRLMASVMILSLLLVAALVFLFFPSRPKREIGPSLTDSASKLMAVFFAWDTMSFFGLSLVAGLLGVFLDRFLAIFLIQLASYSLFLCLVSLTGRKEYRRYFARFSVCWVGRGYFLCLACVFAINLLMGLLWGAAPQSENPILQMFVDAPGWKVALLGALVLAIGPFFEEIIFRGWLYGGLRHRWGDARAALASSLLFALVHGDGPSLIPLFALGLVFCWVYKKSGSLWGSFLVHCFWNATTFAMILSLLP